MDQWSTATATYADNFPSARRNVVTATLSTRTGPELFHDVGRIDLLIASPECTNHSVARGRRPRCSESQRSSSYVLRFVEELTPQHIVIENVEAMRRWDGYARLYSTLEQRHDYKLASQVLDAADFGVPQSRKRLFIFGSRRRRPNEIRRTQAKHRSAATILDRKGTWPAGPLDNGRRAQKTIDRVLYGIQQVGWGKDFLTVYYGSDGAGGYQTLNRPLRTLTTLDRFGLVQWDGNIPTLRMLQVPELKRAMGLPDDFRLLHGSRRDRIRLLGNGVCPPVMQAVVEELLGTESRQRARTLEVAE